MKKNVLIYILSIALLVLLSCSASKQKEGNKINRIKINARYPIKLNENAADIFITDVFVNYYEKYILYELPYHETSSVSQFQEDGSSKYNLEYDSIKYIYFIIPVDSAFGYEFKNLQAPIEKRIVIDSSIMQRTMSALNLNDLFKVITVKEIKKTKYNNTSQLDIYYLIDKVYDSAHFYYDLTYQN